MIYHYNDDDDKRIKKVLNDDEKQCDKHIWAMVLAGWDNDDED